MTKLYVNQAMDAAMDVGPAATLTRVLRQRVGASNSARLVPLDQCEGVLEARIDRTADFASAQTTTVPNAPVTVPSFVVRMTGSLRLVDPAAKVVWQSGAVDVEETYLAGQNAHDNTVVNTESNRRRALERASERLANDLYTRLMEGF